MNHTYRALISAVTLLTAAGPAAASDHSDGEVSINDKAADITDMYIFPSPETPGNLVMIMNSHPYAGCDAHFHDRVSYNFNLRRVSLAGTGTQAGYQLHEAYNFSCTFKATTEGEDPDQINCTGPNGLSVSAKVGELPAAEANARPIKVYAGLREDPFINTVSWFTELVQQSKLPPQAHNDNANSNMNALSIVLEFDPKATFDLDQGTLFAMAGETLTTTEDGALKRIDRAGHPEITNARLVFTEGEDDLRNRYNAEPNFDTSSAGFVDYRKRFEQNLDYYDGLDGVQDWSAEWRPTIINFLVNDYLVVDLAKPYNDGGYLEIENAMLRDQPHSRSGGRTPTQNTINQLFTFLINGGHGPEINSGIPAADPALPTTFPYLNEPATGLIAWFKRKLGGSFVERQVLEARQ